MSAEELVSVRTENLAAVPTEEPEAIQETPAEPCSDKGIGKKKRIVIAVIVVAALLLVGVAGLWYYNDQQQKAAAQAAWDRQHEMHAVVFSTTAPGYSQSTDSAIPLHVTGTDLDGNAVDQVSYIHGDGTGLSLIQGSYTIIVVASPLLANGTLYAVPGTVVTISVDADGNVTMNGERGWVFEVIDVLSITDDQINAAYRYALDSGMSSSDVDALKAKVVGTRDAAVAKKKADDEAAAAAKAAAEAEAARKAALHYSNEYFSLDVPDDWGNTWTVSGDPKTTDITQLGYHYWFRKTTDSHIGFCVCLGPYQAGATGSIKLGTVSISGKKVEAAIYYGASGPADYNADCKVVAEYVAKTIVLY